ncbi:hypothetical protein QFC21_000121 [Naganishia friedmannii]|uniref:Uncharacterized protein n=1 Tax=Naganishia friedmannii TaxID=89922 RepID=A0ACC2WBM0_9TREE|nr:hypothetical protein QFC21_000121 [Naganishia friedmannii]
MSSPDAPQPGPRVAPLELAQSNFDNGKRKDLSVGHASAGSPYSRTPRQRSYTSMASLENDREEFYERENLGPFRGGVKTAGEIGSRVDRQEEGEPTSPNTIMCASPPTAIPAVDTRRMDSLSIRENGHERRNSNGDPGPQSIASMSAQRRKSSNTTTGLVTRSKTLSQVRARDTGPYGSESQEDEESPLATPTRSQRLSLRRSGAQDNQETSFTPTDIFSSSSFLDPGNNIKGIASNSRRSSYRKNSRFVDPEVATRMKRWVDEVVVCNFDLDRGPIVERRMAGRPWAKGEKANVAFSAFPDTSLFQEGQISYSFKIRAPIEEEVVASTDATESYFDAGAKPQKQDEDPLRTPLPTRTSAQSTSRASSISTQRDSGFFGPETEGPETPSTMKVLPTKGETAAEYRKWDEKGRKWLYGYVWFHQRKDKSITRGYMQRSIVILSYLAYPSLFAAMLEKIAPIYFSHGYPALEAACYGIASWPDPVPGAILELPLLTEILTVKLPEMNEAPQMHTKRVEPKPYEPSVILASLPTVSPLRVFQGFLPSLWHIWECLVLGEPLLVIAADPKTCSDIVWWMRDLIRPLPASNLDIRPYLHIHDLDFRLIVNANKPPTGVVVGVTNPFFRNAAGHWPNVVSAVTPRVGTPNAAMGLSQEKQGFQSKRKRHVSKDRVLLKRLEHLVASGQLDDEAGNDALRHHFHQLTEKMLSPLNRYVSSLLPSSELHAAIKPFSLPAFLQHLKALAPNPLQFRSKGLLSKNKVETEFYTTFCTAGSFMAWYQEYLASINAERGVSWPLVDWPSSTSQPRVSESTDSYVESRSSGTRGSGDLTPRSSLSSFNRPSSSGSHVAGRQSSSNALWSPSLKRQ